MFIISIFFQRCLSLTNKVKRHVNKNVHIIQKNVRYNSYLNNENFKRNKIINQLSITRVHDIKHTNLTTSIAFIPKTNFHITSPCHVSYRKNSFRCYVCSNGLQNKPSKTFAIIQPSFTRNITQYQIIAVNLLIKCKYQTHSLHYKV